MNAKQLKRFLNHFGITATCVDFQIVLKNQDGEIVSTHNSLTSLHQKLFGEDESTGDSLTADQVPFARLLELGS